MTKQITGSSVHGKSGIPATYVAEYRTGLAGIYYSATVVLEGCPPSRQSGFMVWSRKHFPPGRAVERTVRDSIQFLDVAALLAKRDRA
ncbi:hypothetical protein [Roseateles sp.]|uniref:hypothetical protein n=1 Tax=Roseateles sp. TaxID=1971397 RepID=UPI002DFCFF58|nr:hypothetical protein [Roseateles sp.]